MESAVDLRGLRKSLGFSAAMVARAMGVKPPAYGEHELEGRVLRHETVMKILKALNALLSESGSERRVTYDQLWSAICSGRPSLMPVTPPDTAADLAAVDSAPAAQPSAIVKRTIVKHPAHASDSTTDGAA
ncbi:MAG: hypothetical protein RL030_2774 [Pseudomonadota bacterium]|jgi:transcriptional regulator with XRE-family HTH domain